jgi:hypothetical protein
MKWAKIGFILVASLLTLAIAHTSDAGQSFGNGSAYCYDYGVGGGVWYCSGSLAGYRSSSDPSAYVELSVEPPSYVTFYSYLNGKSHACTVSASQIPLFQAIATAPPQTYFYIQGDNTGQCSAMSFESASFYE